MTQTADTGKKVSQPELVTLTIDGTEISVPKGTLVIRAAELIGVQIPRFCDHPLLDPVGACRQCLVEIEGQRKPMASCTIPVTDDMVVRTQFSSQAADKPAMPPPTTAYLMAGPSPRGRGRPGGPAGPVPWRGARRGRG